MLNNPKFRENYIHKNFFFWKPSKLFWIISLIVFFIWIVMGPTSWRHIDDFGPIQSYLLNDFSFESWKYFIKYKLFIGWGSYPPIWTLWQLISFPFLEIGLTQSRYILLIQGFISTLIGAYLTKCLCLNFYTYINLEKNYNIKKIKYFIEVLSIAFNCLNPEIMLHASSYMPYNLSSLTTISLLLLLFPCNLNSFEKRKNFNNYFFKIPLVYFLFFAFLTICFGFQSPIIFFAFLITFMIKIILNNLSLKKLLSLTFNESIIFINQIFNFKKNLFLPILILLAFFFFTYTYKFLILLAADTKAGSFLDITDGLTNIKWSTGIDDLYNINFDANNVKSWIIKTINNTSAIIALAVYPFRNFQESIGRLIFIPLILSFLIISRINKSSFLFATNTGLVFFITIILSSLDKLVFSPTRHTIFLYPYIWLVVIISSLKFFIFIESSFARKSYFYFVNLSLSIFLFYSIGLANSHQLIQYSGSQRDKLIELSKKADFHIDYFYSFFASHGSKEFRASRLEQCDPNLKYDKPKFFIYSHRDIGLKTDSIETLKSFLLSNSNGCVKKNHKIKLIDKIEFLRTFDIEQNNKIYNGGSSIYGYLIEVDTSD